MRARLLSGVLTGLAASLPVASLLAATSPASAQGRSADDPLIVSIAERTLDAQRLWRCAVFADGNVVLELALMPEFVSRGTELMGGAMNDLAPLPRPERAAIHAASVLDDAQGLSADLSTAVDHAGRSGADFALGWFYARVERRALSEIYAPLDLGTMTTDELMTGLNDGPAKAFEADGCAELLVRVRSNGTGKPTEASSE